jgi:uncharacterized membrane protein
MRMRFVALPLRLLLLTLGAAGAAQADPLPATFQVAGVAEGDVLNIRAEPSAGSAIVGTIGPYGFGVEVLRLSDDGKWGLVGLPEGNGWVAMRYLRPAPATDPALVPRPLTCHGTEPFWTLGLFPKGAEWTTPDTPRTDLTVSSEGVAPEGYLIRAEEGPTRVFHLIIGRGFCSDGMSDREFGLEARLFLESPDGNRLLQGCCTLDHRD